MSEHAWQFRCTYASNVTHYSSSTNPDRGILTLCRATVPWPDFRKRGSELYDRWCATDVDCMACIAFRVRMESP